MGEVTHHGWRTCTDEIPQPTSIITGANLRKKPTPAPSVDRPFGFDHEEIAKRIAEQQRLADKD